MITGSKIPMMCQICNRKFSTIHGLHTHFRFKHCNIMTWVDYIKTFLESFCIKNGKGCWNWKGFKDKDGYGRVRLLDNTTTGAHRLAYESEFGKFSKDLFVCHSCDNPSCVNPDHLWIGSQQDNIDDMVRKGRICHGNRHYWKTPEMRKRLSMIHTGRKHSIESKIKMSKNNAMNKLENRLKVSMALMGEKNHASRAVIIDNIRYVSLTDAGRSLGVDPSTISYRIRHNKPGYKFV